MNEIECSLRLDYDHKREAMAVKDSIEPDNEDYIELELEDSTLICEAEGEPLQLLHTVDDLLMCVNVAEKILGL
ncbi:MAG: KEOPS complex subunit Pcc1 [Candidatus Thermoplasmatota archaeon]